MSSKTTMLLKKFFPESPLYVVGNTKFFQDMIFIPVASQEEAQKVIKASRGYLRYARVTTKRPKMRRGWRCQAFFSAKYALEYMKSLK